nr:hypothetical protein [Bradyrhizobium elkanii]
MVKELRHLLASAISDAKAYDVPGLCRRLNLADGDEQEAFSSKYKYAQKRLVEVSAEQVVASARQLAAEEQHFELSEQLAKIDELNGPAVTILTRRRLIALFEGRPLAREIDDIELIRSLWPIGSMRAPHPSDEATLEDYLHRHTIRNDDLTQRDVLETLGLLSCSRAHLFKFLAAVTAPDAFSGNEQVELAGKIDGLLRHDGYTLALAGRISGSPILRCAAGADRIAGGCEHLRNARRFRPDAGARALDHGYGAARLGTGGRDHIGTHPARRRLQMDPRSGGRDLAGG